MLEINEKNTDARSSVRQLMEIIDHGFENCDYVWHQFLNDWQKSFAVDIKERARSDANWTPTDKQQVYVRSIVAKLELHLYEIKEYDL